MAFPAAIDVGAAQVDAEIFAFSGAGRRLSGSWPAIATLYYSADASVAVELYLAPAGGAAADANRVYLVNDTLASAARFCFPIPLDGSTGAVWRLFCNKPTTGGAGTAFVRLEWEAGGEGR